MQKSYFGIPLSALFHILAININLYFLTPDTYRYGAGAVLYYNLAWFVISRLINFYAIERHAVLTIKNTNFLRLFLLYGLAFFASFIFLGPNIYSPLYLTGVYALICFQLVLFRIFFYWAKSIYRSNGQKTNKVVVVGRDENLNKLRAIFDSTENNFKYVGFFDNKKYNDPSYLGSIESCYQYIFENDISELYCTASRLSKDEIKNLIRMSDNGLKRLKIIPDNKELFSQAMSIELYGTVPVLNLRASPLELEYAKFVKRVFDIVFSSLVILFILSWMAPIVYLLQKLDSKGPLLFKQIRHGANKKTFVCYKFRSMVITEESDTLMATKNDMRITRLGRILRKTSIDEFPQFFNVLMGDMSVVGPRPHMELHTEQYQSTVDKYLVRHFLKPGITGLAQVKGYRGEIVDKSDMVNRVRYDVFYMEKWSLSLDLTIIYYTVFNVLGGEKMAY